MEIGITGGEEDGVNNEDGMHDCHQENNQQILMIQF
jgi:fructose/tagatose bisphosphate aldolase